MTWQFGRASTLLAQAIEPLQKTGNTQEQANNAGYLGFALAQRGQYREGLVEAQRGLAIAQASQNLTSLALSYLYLAQTHFAGGEWAESVAACEVGLSVTDRSGDRVTAYVILGIEAWSETRLGRLEPAAAAFAKLDALVASLGGRLIVADWFAAARAEFALRAGRIEESITLSQQAVALAKTVNGVFGEGEAERVWGQALATAEHFEEAETHLAASVRALESGDAQLEAARTQAIWGTLLAARQLPAAREHLEAARAQLERSSLAAELAQIQEQIASLDKVTSP